MMLKRNKINNDIDALVSHFGNPSPSVRQGQRYDFVYDYLKASPSYRAAQSMLDGGKPAELPADCAVVAEVVRDFGDLRRIRPSNWWKEIGAQLYGITAPLTEVRLLGELRENDQKLRSKWTGIDALVLEIPKTLTLSQAIKQVRKALAPHDFASPLPEQVAAKYVLMKSNVRLRTLAQGVLALRFYSQGMPLWQIGNRLRLIPAQAFDEKALAKEEHHKVSYEKEVLSIAARRLVRTALLIAENAARGRYPSDRPFAEAMVGSYKRKAGRPMGSTSPKRRKAGA